MRCRPAPAGFKGPAPRHAAAVEWSQVAGPKDLPYAARRGWKQPQRRQCHVGSTGGGGPGRPARLASRSADIRSTSGSIRSSQRGQAGGTSARGSAFLVMDGLCGVPVVPRVAAAGAPEILDRRRRIHRHGPRRAAVRTRLARGLRFRRRSEREHLSNPPCWCKRRHTSIVNAGGNRHNRVDRGERQGTWGDGPDGRSVTGDERSMIGRRIAAGRGTSPERDPAGGPRSGGVVNRD